MLPLDIHGEFVIHSYSQSNINLYPHYHTNHLLYSSQQSIKQTFNTNLPILTWTPT